MLIPFSCIVNILFVCLFLRSFLKLQNVPGLTVQHFTDGIQSRKPDCFYFPGF